MVEDTNFKFGTPARRVSPDMTPENFFEKAVWPGSCDPLNFWTFNANSSKMTKDANFKFGTNAQTETRDITPEKNFRTGGMARVT